MYGGIEWLTNWGVHGTSLSFVAMWLPYSFKWYNAWGDKDNNLPSYVIDWLGNAAIFF